MPCAKEYNKMYCIECGKELIKGRHVSIATYYNRKFCSANCHNINNTKTNTLVVKCIECGKEVKRKKSHVFNKVFCSPKCQGIHNTKQNSKIVSCDFCKKEFKKTNSQLSETNLNFCSRKCSQDWQSINFVGANSPTWKGGLTEIRHCIRTNRKSEDWRNAVFLRDQFACKLCGDKRGGNLQAHHIKHFYEILIDNNIKTIEDAVACDELWDLENGITLCKPCHEFVHKKDFKLIINSDQYEKLPEDLKELFEPELAFIENTHSTVKPTQLLRYLLRLVTPPGATVIDPFFGSGSTGKAALLEGFKVIGIEREPEYFDIAVARCAHVSPEAYEVKPTPAKTAAPPAQGSLL